jgi:hypothetical protein
MFLVHFYGRFRAFCLRWLQIQKFTLCISLHIKSKIMT